MAITPTAAQNSILMLNVAMFGQAAGTTVMAAGLPTFVDGNTYAQQLYTTSDAYKILSPEQAFTKVINNLSAGTSITAADVAALAKGMVPFVDAGLTVGATINLLTAFLYNNAGKLTGDAAGWNSTAVQLVNKTTAASVYTLDQNNAASSTSAIANVTDQIDTTLTVYPDKLSGNLFNAPQAYVPGGNDLVNTLQNDDVLTGTTGTTDTLNATLGNPNDNGAAVITPTLTGVEIINAKYDATSSSMTLDLQDSTGVTTINISRIAEGLNGTVQNIADSTATTLSVNNSFSPNNAVDFTYLASAVSGSADAANVTLSNVNTAQLRIEERGTAQTQGFEAINLASSGSANSINTSTSAATSFINNTGFQAEDLKTLNITGDQGLTISGFGRVSGSFTTLDASAATGAMSLDMFDNVSNRNILVAAPDGTSSGTVAFALTTGTANDTVIITRDGTAGINANDSVNLGNGTDILRLQSNMGSSAVTVDFVASNTTAQVSGVETVQVYNTTTRANTAAAAVNPTAAAGTAVMALRAGQLAGDQTIVLGDRTSTTAANVGVARSTYNIADLSATEAANISIVHSGSGNPAAASNGITHNVVNLDVADGVSAVTMAITEGVNTDPRFNFQLYTDSDRALNATGNTWLWSAATPADNSVNAVTSLTLADNDTKTNTVQLLSQGWTATAGFLGQGTAYSTINLTGGTSGSIMNLDATLGAAAAALGSGYGLSQTGANGDNTSIQQAAGLQDGTVSAVFRDAGAAAGQRLMATVFNASTYSGNVVARFNEVLRADGVSSMAITTNTGNDTFIFDAQNNASAGFTAGDTIAAGTGTDTLIIDGGNAAGITLQKSEWDNLTGIDVLRLGLNVAAARAYTVEIDDHFVSQTDAGNNLLILSNDGDYAVEHNSNTTLNLRALSQNKNVTYVGANGNTDAGGAATTTVSTVQVNDNSATSLNTLNGGDKDVSDRSTGVGWGQPACGNTNVLQVYSETTGAHVSVNDLANTKNFQTINFINNAATAQTMQLFLNDTVVGNLVDASHTATTAAGQQENLTITATDNGAVALAYAALNIDASAITTSVHRITVNAGGAADTIVGGGAADTITGGAGADRLTGGASADHFVAALNDGITATTGVVLAAADTITDFVTGTDKISSGLAGATEGVIANGTALANWAAFVVAVDAVFTAGGGANDGIYISWNAIASGNTYVAIDQNDSGSLDAGDSLIVLTGLNTAAGIALADFI